MPATILTRRPRWWRHLIVARGFVFRPGVHWQDKPPMNGRELVADDIVFSFHRMTGLGSGFTEKSAFGSVANLPIESITAPDKYTVVFKLTKLDFIAFEEIYNTSPAGFISAGGNRAEWPHAGLEDGGRHRAVHADGLGAGQRHHLHQEPQYWGLLILITVMSLVGQGLLQTILVLGISGGIGGSRIARSAVIGIRENMYLQAAEAFGASATRTIFRHVLPNIMAPMIITFTVTIGGVIMAEASLSFLGFGLPPNVASWGGMLSNDGRRFLELAPWLAIWPGLALTIVVYSLNMLGDALRDLLDPRLKGGVGRLGAHHRAKQV